MAIVVSVLKISMTWVSFYGTIHITGLHYIGASIPLVRCQERHMAL